LSQTRNSRTWPGLLVRLNGELVTRDIRFRPRCWLSQKWFSPDGIPGIAIPFHLAHLVRERFPRVALLQRADTRRLTSLRYGKIEIALRA
jgi:hypothetical protein